MDPGYGGGAGPPSRPREASWCCTPGTGTLGMWGMPNGAWCEPSGVGKPGAGAGPPCLFFLSFLNFFSEPEDEDEDEDEDEWLRRRLWPMARAEIKA